MFLLFYGVYVRVKQPSLRHLLYEESRRRPSEQPAIFAGIIVPAQINAVHNIGTASRVYSVFRELRICLKMLCMYRFVCVLLYATISQEKPAVCKVLIVSAPISKSAG